ncbi:MAG: rhomboid family intramembrane serine protease [Microthrixaceae bacterium]
MEPATQTHCYKHPDRAAGVTCQRCDRPICPSCMRQASVGFHCPECAAGHSTKVISGPAAFSSGSNLLVTKVLIGINAAIWLAMTITGQSATGAAGPIFENGATFGPFIAQGEWHRLVSGAFLHAGFLHLAMNMFLLWLLGQVLEPALGKAQFVAVYFVSLLGGSLGVMLLDPGSATVGASGAVFGLMGALVVLQLRAGQNPWQSGIGTLVVLNLVITFAVPGISIGGHLGGLVAGAISALAVVPQAAASQQGRSVAVLARVGSLMAFGVLLAWASIVVVGNEFPGLVPA